MSSCLLSFAPRSFSAPPFVRATQFRIPTRIQIQIQTRIRILSDLVRSLVLFLVLGLVLVLAIWCVLRRPLAAFISIKCKSQRGIFLFEIFFFLPWPCYCCLFSRSRSRRRGMCVCRDPPPKSGNVFHASLHFVFRLFASRPKIWGTSLPFSNNLYQRALHKNASASHCKFMKKVNLLWLH